MIVRIREAWTVRSERERRLIAVMGAIALPLLLWLGVVTPLMLAYDEARERHAQSVDRHARIIARADLVEKGGPDVRATEASSAPIELIVAEAASEAGFTVDSNAPQGPDATSVTIASARPSAVVSWLAEFEARGIAVQDLRLTPVGPGTVAVSVRLTRSGG